jgi:hypothetical protein
VDDIKVDLREIGWGDMGWIDVAQDRDQWRALVNIAADTTIPSPRIRVSASRLVTQMTLVLSHRDTGC